jgi:hypothetical protein
MRRAIAALALLLALAALDAPRTRAETITVMNGIGLVDYRHKPDFKIGDWVRYHMKSHSELGASDDYELTLLVAGEEDFWGDPGSGSRPGWRCRACPPRRAPRSSRTRSSATAWRRSGCCSTRAR